MVGLTVTGVLVGLIPAIALGLLVDALVERNDRPEAVLLAGLIALAIVLEAVAYIASDMMYVRNTSRLYRNLRVQMFTGALRRSAGGADTAGLASRFVSDAETFEQVTISLIDTGTMQLVEFASALVAVWLLQPSAVVVVLPALACIWIVTETDAGAGRSRRAAPPGGAGGHDELDHVRTRSPQRSARLQSLPWCRRARDGS